jgi:hypothetical protein
LAEASQRLEHSPGVWLAAVWCPASPPLRIHGAADSLPKQPARRAALRATAWGDGGGAHPIRSRLSPGGGLGVGAPVSFGGRLLRGDVDGAIRRARADGRRPEGERDGANGGRGPSPPTRPFRPACFAPAAAEGCSPVTNRSDSQQLEALQPVRRRRRVAD